MRTILVALTLFCSAALANVALADGPGVGGTTTTDGYELAATQRHASESAAHGTRPGRHHAPGLASVTHASQPIRLSASVCRGLSNLAVCGGTDALCTMSAHVMDGQIYGGGARPVGCTPAQAAQAGAGPAPLPQVTPGLVLTALRRVGLPSATARTQPEDKTLVNFETIFYARTTTVTRTLTLLGQQVQVQATPQSYLWHYGDGTRSTTTMAGAPYPAKDITHAYTDAHVTVQTSVDVSYSGRFRVGNGGWQAIPGAVTIDGPPAPLRVSEASGVLSGSYN